MKNSARRWIGSVVALALLSGNFFTSCTCSSKKTEESMMERTLENATGEKTDVDIKNDKVTIEGENYKTEINNAGGKWSDEIPDDVPEFTYGTIEHSTVSVAEGTKTFGLFYKGVDPSVLDKYDAALKKNGFKTMKMTMEKGGTITAEKGKIIVTAIASEKGTHVSVQLRKEE
jgi:hypothetical protein